MTATRKVRMTPQRRRLIQRLGASEKHQAPLHVITDAIYDIHIAPGWTRIGYEPLAKGVLSRLEAEGLVERVPGGLGWWRLTNTGRQLAEDLDAQKEIA